MNQTPMKEISAPVVEKVQVHEEKPKEEPKVVSSTKSLDRIREIKEKKKNKFTSSVVETSEKENQIIENVDKAEENVKTDIEDKASDNVVTIDKTEEQNYQSL